MVYTFCSGSSKVIESLCFWYSDLYITLYVYKSVAELEFFVLRQRKKIMKPEHTIIALLSQRISTSSMVKLLKGCQPSAFVLLFPRDFLKVS